MYRSKEFDIRYLDKDKNIVDPDSGDLDSIVDVVPWITGRLVNDGKGFLILPATHNSPAIYEYPDPENRLNPALIEGCGFLVRWSIACGDIFVADPNPYRHLTLGEALVSIGAEKGSVTNFL